MIERTYKHYIEPTPEELAGCFWSMDAEQQATFFNGLAVEIGESGAFCRQLQEVTDSPLLTPGGRRIMEQIGEYHDEILEFLNAIKKEAEL